MSVLLILFIAVFLLLFGGILWSVLKHSLKIGWALLVNAVLGVLAIFFLDMLGFGIPINNITLIISALFGLFGVAVLAILSIL